MRTRMSFVFGIIGLAAASASAQALTFYPADTATAPSAGVEEAAVRHCNPGFHWLHSHHAKDGRLIHGQCVRDHHH